MLAIEGVALFSCGYKKKKLAGTTHMNVVVMQL